MIINIDTLQINAAVTQTCLTKGVDNVGCVHAYNGHGHVTDALISALIVASPRPPIEIKAKRALMLLQLIEKTGLNSLDLVYHCDLQKKSSYRLTSYHSGLSFLISINTSKNVYRVTSVTFSHDIKKEHEAMPYMLKQIEVMNKLTEDLFELNKKISEVLTLY